MKITVRDATFDIEDSHALASPVLRHMVEGKFQVEDPEFDFEPTHFAEYVKYLQGERFEINEEVAKVFDFLGHSNDMGYPLDFWGVKLRDNWIRDNFYRLELWRYPYFGLQEIPKLAPEHIPVPEGCVVAGGAALWLSQPRNPLTYRLQPKDIDIFVVQQDGDVAKANERMKDISMEISDRYGRDTSKYNTVISRNAINTHICYNDRYQVPAQYILRLYKSPAEVVYGFDLDACGILWDGEKLWATDRAAYALQHRCNWFDPTRASPSYAYRLSKYCQKGFEIRIPSVTEANFHLPALSDMRKRMADFLLKNSVKLVEVVAEGIREDEVEPFDADNFRLIEWVANNTLTNITAAQYRDLFRIQCAMGMSQHYPTGSLFYYIEDSLQGIKKEHPELLKEWRSIVPNDDVSILMLSQYGGFFTYLWSKSDYCAGGENKAFTAVPIEDSQEKDGKVYPLANFDTSVLEWKLQDPGTQVTSTFCPAPIENVQEWLSSSPFYKK